MSNGRARVSVWRRWLRTTWKMSPAWMYSLHFSTAASNAAGSKFERVRQASPRRPASMSVSLQVGDALVQPLDQPIHALAGAGGSCRARSAGSTWAWATTAMVLLMWSKMTMRS